MGRRRNRGADVSDAGGPETEPLPDDVYSWVGDFFALHGWDAGPQPVPVVAGPTAADVMAAAIGNPRPVDLTVPAGATEAEATEIETAYAVLVAQLENHGVAEDLGDAPAQRDAIRALVGQVPLRIAAEAEARQHRADALRLRLTGLDAPDGALADEKTALTQAVLDLAAELDGALTETLLADVLARTEVIEGRAATLATAVAARAERAKALVAGIVALSAPPGAMPDEALAIGTRKTALTDRLLPPLADDVLDQVAADAMMLSDDVAALATRVTARQERAKALVAALALLNGPAGAMATETQAIRDRATALTDLLVPPLADDVLDQVAAAAKLLAEDVTNLATRVTARQEKALALVAALAVLDGPAGALHAEAQAIRDRATALTGDLAGELGDTLLTDTQAALDTLNADIAALVLTVQSRTDRATQKRLQIGLVAAPADATAAEVAALTLAVNAARDKLVVLYDEAMILGADTDLGLLAAQVTTITDAIAHRAALRLLADAQLVALGTKVAPPDASLAEVAEVAALVQAATDALALPLTDTVIADGNAALIAIDLKTAQITQDIAARALRRTALTGLLALIPVPDGARPDEVKATAKTRAALLKELTDAATLADINLVDPKIVALGVTVATLMTLAAERRAAAADIAAAKATQAANGNALDRGFYSYLTQAIATAEAALAAAPDIAAIATLRADLATALGHIPAALLYATDQALWDAQTMFYLSCKVPAADPHDLAGLRNTLANAAAARSLVLDFAGARAQLANFAAGANVVAADLTEATAFEAIWANFNATHGAAIKNIMASKLPAGNAMAAELAVARKMATKTFNFVAATPLLAAVGVKVLALTPIANAWASIAALPAAEKTVAPVLGALNVCKVQCTAGNYGPALAALTGINPVIVARAAALKRLAGLRSRAAPMELRILPANFAHLRGPLDLAEVDINTPDLPAATIKMDAADALLLPMLAWSARLAELIVQRVQADPGDALHLMDAAAALAAAQNYVGARAALDTAATGYAALAGYTVARAQALTLQSAHAAATAPRLLIDTALTEADDLCVAQRRPADGKARLLTLFAVPILAEQAADAGDWVARRDAVQKRHTRVVARLEPANIKATVEGGMTAAAAKGDVDHDYPAALKLLDDHATLLDGAADFAVNRRRAIAVKASLDRAALQFAAVPATLALIYVTMDDAALVTALTDADAKALTGDMAGASQDYADLITTCQAMIANTAQAYETADAAGTNAGHSLGRHGPGVTDQQLLDRLLTGIAPDNAWSPTDKSSKFENYAAWLEARETSANAVNGRANPDGTLIDLTQTAINPRADALFNEPFIVDHSGPIDKACKGVKPAMAIDEDGKIGDAKTFESFEQVDGITKSTARWIFVFDLATLAALPGPMPPPPPPPSPLAFPSRDGNRVNTPAAYIASWTAWSLGAPPVTIPGKWVMMQLFPLVDGWNQEMQDYV